MNIDNLLPIAKDYGPIIVGLTAAVIALLLGLGQLAIARMQAKTAANAAQIARNKLKFDLFDRRLSVYKALVTRLNNVKKYERIDYQEQLIYEDAVAGVRWLFGREFALYIKSITDVLHSYDIIQSDYVPTRSDAPKELREAWSSARTELFRFKEGIDEKFAEYLELQN